MNESSSLRGNDPVEPAPGVGVATAVTAVAGREAVVQVAVRNDSLHPRTLQVALLGLDPDWLPAPQRTEVVAPGEVAQVRFVLTPARGAVAADYPFVVTGQSLDPVTGEPRSSRPGIAESVLTVSPRATVSIKVVPGEFSTVARRRFTVQVRNEGDTPTTVHLSSTQPHNARISLSRTEVVVGARSTLSVRAAARLRRPRLFGWVGQHRFTVSANGTDAQTHAEGIVLQRPLAPPFVAKALAVVTALVLWVSAAVVFLPQFGQWIRSATNEANRKVTEQVTGHTARGGDTIDEDGAASEGPDSAGGGANGHSGDETGNGAGGGNVVVASHTSGIQLTGTVATNAPAGVRVQLAPTSLVDEAAQSGIGIGVPKAAVETGGLRLASAFTRVGPRQAQPTREMSTTTDGSYAFSDVKQPGYYLLSFTKPGYQTRTYVVDSSSEAATQPLEVPMTTGEGSLTGTVRGPRGPLAGAEVTITDGTNIVTTSTNSKGRVGAWAVKGLSTPGSYVVQASTHGMSSEARLVRIEAGGSAAADLHLSPGVATLTGMLTREDQGQQVGLGGAKVTVSDGAGTTRTATTLTQGRVGFYTIPSLKAPGRYSVTLSADGFQQRTTTLVLKRGQSLARLSALLTSAVGTLSGQMRGPRGGIVGAGLVLSSADNTYKTTSTSSPRAGAYRFNGVTPGTYTLTTTMFGLVTDRVTVTLTSGGERVVNRTLSDEAGDGVPNTAVLFGSVTDLSTGQPLRACRGDHPRAKEGCVRATVDDTTPSGGGTEPRTVTYTDDFDPTESYRLPAEGVKGGLRPGLHTVQVSAPGYMTGTVEVQVGLGQSITAPDLALPPVPTISGMVTTPRGVLGEPACVWVVPGAKAKTPTRADCLSAIAAGADPKTPRNAPDACFPARYTWEAIDSVLTRACAVTDMTPGQVGQYAIEVPSQGTFTVLVTPTDREYDGAKDLRTTNPAQDSLWNPVLNRRPILDVKVLRPGTTNTLEPVPGVTLSVDPAPSVRVPATATDGTVTLRGLQSGTVTVRATDPEDARQSGSRTITLGTNAHESLRLVLDTPTNSLLGRVSSHVFGQTQRVEGAKATLRVATTYPDNKVDTPPTSKDVDVMTSSVAGSRGCFEVRTRTAPPRVTSECSTVTGNAVGLTGLASSRVPKLTVKADHYDLWQDEDVLFSPGVEEIVLTPSPVEVRASVDTVPTATDWSSSKVTATAMHGSQTKATPTIDQGKLSWQETGRSESNVATPGDYQVRVTMDGYTEATGILRCAIGASCGWITSTGAPTSKPVLKAMGTVTIQVNSAYTGVALKKASVSVKWGNDSLTGLVTDNNGQVSIDGVDANASTPSGPTSRTGLVTVKAAGHVHATSAALSLAGDDVQLTCAPAGGPSSGVLRVLPGASTTCVAALKPLATLTGTVVSRLHPEAPGQMTETLAGATVTARRCTSTDCSALLPGETFTTTTDTDGRFSITGDNTRQGLVAGSWALLPGKGDTHEWTGDKHGQRVVVSVPTSGTDPNPPVELVMRQATRSVNVTVVSSSGAPLAGASVSRSSEYRPTETYPKAQGLPGRLGVYQFTQVEPGYWSFIASAPNMLPTKVILPVLSGNGGQEITIALTPKAGSVTGSVTDQSAAALQGSEVSLLCRPDGHSSQACRADDGVALDMHGNPLRTTTDAQGEYTLSLVRAGRYDVVATLHGHLDVNTGQSRFIDVTVPGDFRADFQLKVIESPVSWKLTQKHGQGAPLTGAALTLAPTRGPGRQVRLENLAVPRAVPWGCYQVTVELPDGVLGDIGTLGATGQLPSDPSLGCGSGELTVPMGGPFVQEPIDLAQKIDTLPLRVTVQMNAASANPLPAVGLSLTPDRGQPTIVPMTGATTELWLPPDTWQVTASATPESPFWPSASEAIVLAPDSNDLTLEVAEETKLVTVHFPRGGWLLEVTPGAGQQSDSPQVVPGPDPTTGTIALPRGRWLLQATWPSTSGTVHDDVRQLHATDPTALSETFEDPNQVTP